MAGGGGACAACFLECFSRLSCFTTVRQAGFAGDRGASSIGGGGGGASTLGPAGGFQSGVYSPPAPCLDLTAINSAISYCKARRSSRNWPTSCSRMRTSFASALLKSFKYFGGACWPLLGGFPDILQRQLRERQIGLLWFGAESTGLWLCMPHNSVPFKHTILG